MLPAWMIDQVKKRDEDREDATLSVYEYSRNCPSDNSDCDDDDGDTPVLNAGSGGGPSPPPAPDPQAEARAQMQLEAERSRIAEENRVKQEERDAAKLEKDKAAFQSRLGSSYTSAQGYGSGQLAARGIRDDYGILPAYYSELDRARANVPDLDPNPGSYFGPALFETALGSARENQRRSLTRRYETEVPEGFENTFIPDTADDALIEAIIGEQFGEAQTALERSRDRGQLNASGFDTAMRGLTQSRSGAVGRANELGMGVLETGREGLRTTNQRARQRIGDWDFGDQFDPNAYEGQIRSGASAFTGGLEGKLRNAFGSTQFFDPDTFVLKGSKAQGAVNPGATALQGAMSEEEKRRSAGSVGAF